MILLALFSSLVGLPVHVALCYVVYYLCRREGYDFLLSVVLGFFWPVGLIVAAFTAMVKHLHAHVNGPPQAQAFDE